MKLFKTQTAEETIHLGESLIENLPSSYHVILPSSYHLAEKLHLQKVLVKP